MSQAKGIAAGKHITGQILEQIDRPDRRLLLLPPLKAEGQLKSIAAHPRVITLFLIELGKAVGHIVPVGNAVSAFPYLHAVQGIVPAQSVGDDGAVEKAFLVRVEPVHRLRNGVKAGLRQICFVAHNFSSFLPVNSLHPNASS